MTRSILTVVQRGSRERAGYYARTRHGGVWAGRQDFQAGAVNDN